jgi:N-acetylmuramoyl-L-alanine amidase
VVEGSVKVTDTDILVGALTIYGEARGDTQEGKVAVAHTIVNRCKAQKWWGKGYGDNPDHSIATVCLKPSQFSCWNDGDPNKKTLFDRRAEGFDLNIADKDFRACLKALIDAVDGFTVDHTKGSTHYLTTKLHASGKGPEWAKRGDYIEIGAHRFFRGIE